MEHRVVGQVHAVRSVASGHGAVRDSVQEAIVSKPEMVHPYHALYPTLLETVKTELEAATKPKLFSRIDEIVVFSPLSLPDLTVIAKLNVDKMVARARDGQ
jgi:ATP-dependent Clp protease ATP-binding subunit ClpA